MNILVDNTWQEWQDFDAIRVQPGSFPTPTELQTNHQLSEIMQMLDQQQKQQWVQPEVNEVSVSMECTSYAEILTPAGS